MFYNAQAFNQPIGNWNTSKVIRMNHMFFGATSFNQPIDYWTTSSVTTMQQMFNGATAFNQNLQHWNISEVTDMQYMLYGTAISPKNYNKTLIGWSSQIVKPGVILHADGGKYCNQNARDTLTGSPNNWTIVDAGIDASGCELAPVPHLTAFRTSTPDNTY